jgi:CRISPR-associated protein Cas2
MRMLLVAYDVADPDRLRRTARVLEDYGKRLQQSVFVCVLRPDDADELLEEARDCMDATADRLIVLPLCDRCREDLTQYGESMPLPDAVTGYIA